MSIYISVFRPKLARGEWVFKRGLTRFLFFFLLFVTIKVRTLAFLYLHYALYLMKIVVF